MNIGTSRRPMTSMCAPAGYCGPSSTNRSTASTMSASFERNTEEAAEVAVDDSRHTLPGVGWPVRLDRFCGAARRSVVGRHG